MQNNEEPNKQIRQASIFENAIRERKFAITSEFSPPRGVDIAEIKRKAELLKDNVIGVNISDLQSSRLSLGALATSHLLKNMGLNPIYQITCRDRNRLALQSDILSAYVLGIKDILVLTGDHPVIGDHPQAKPVFDLDSVQLLYTIKKLESGYDLTGKGLNKKPIFFKGAAVNPEADTKAGKELQLIKMIKKIEQGTQFFQTMPVFDTCNFEKFIESIYKMNIDIPVLAGIQLIKSEKMALHMNKFIPGVNVPKYIIKKISKAEDKISMSLEIAADIINKIKDICAGIHIGAQGWEKYIPLLIKKIDK